MEQFLNDHWMDILGTLTGLIYVYQEYKASIYLWITGIIMPVIYIFVYYDAGLYADFGMSIYYALAAIYGYVAWKLFKEREDKEIPITHFPKKYLLPAGIIFVVLWAGIYLILIHFTNSTVPVLDSFGNALSIIGLWALARKYLEQWWIWIVVDLELSLLYLYKDLLFTGGLYALYVIISFAGIRQWKKMMATQSTSTL